jgi:hypothetical protein
MLQLDGEHTAAYWLRRDPIIRMVAGFEPYKINEFINLSTLSGSIRSWGLLSL